MTVARRFKGYFLHGLAVLLPSILTIWLFVWGYTFIQNNISRHINRGLVYIIAMVDYNDVEISKAEVKTYLLEVKKPELKGQSEELIETNLRRNDIWREAKINKRENELAKVWVSGYGSIVGFLIAVVGVCIIGAVLASFVGKKIWHRMEKFIMTTPLLRRVYPYIKQFTDFLLTQEEDQKKKLFSRVVAVEYPRAGIWTLGFVTGAGFDKVVNTIKKEFLTVFVPTAPAPFTGFIITIPKELVIDLNITIEEAIRFIVSGGIVAPGHQIVSKDAPEAKHQDDKREKEQKIVQTIKES
jgi:uncharacterized membrane protein